MSEWWVAATQHQEHLTQAAEGKVRCSRAPRQCSSLWTGTSTATIPPPCWLVHAGLEPATLWSQRVWFSGLLLSNQHNLTSLYYLSWIIPKTLNRDQLGRGKAVPGANWVMSCCFSISGANYTKIELKSQSNLTCTFMLVNLALCFYTIFYFSCGFLSALHCLVVKLTWKIS